MGLVLGAPLWHWAGRKLRASAWMAQLSLSAGEMTPENTG